MGEECRGRCRWIWSLLITLVLLPIAFGVNVWIANDEVLQCKFRRWRAGGAWDDSLKQEVPIKATNGQVTADFRGLSSHWSLVCLASFYVPGSPHLTQADSDRLSKYRTPVDSDQHLGCWQGDDPAHLQLIVVNRVTREQEHYTVRLPHELVRSPTHASKMPIIATDYRTGGKMPDGSFWAWPDARTQCQDTETAVARCLLHEMMRPGYCLLLF